MSRSGADHRDRAEIEERIGYTFRDPSLLLRALTRLAYTLEAGLPADAHMDALATLGDAVINVAVVEAVVVEGAHDKGAITNRKMNLVNMTRLRALAEDLDLADYVRWGKGEAAQKVWTSGRVLAECLEALIGAVYLDGGMGAAAGVLRRLGLTERV
ncbi:MAG: ribonuclease III domain-containing protein [Methanoculleus sp.]